MLQHFDNAPHSQEALAYAYDVVNGHVLACIQAQQACQRFIKDLQELEGFVYDVEKAWTNQPQLFWNGRVMNTGPDCPAGSYFVLYTLYLDGPDAPPTQLHGAITLLR